MAKEYFNPNSLPSLLKDEEIENNESEEISELPQVPETEEEFK